MTGKRKVFVVSLGSSPSVVTETLWALAHRPAPFWPDEAHIVTTQGARNLGALADLTAPQARRIGPKLAELCAELRRPQFPVTVHFPKIADSRSRSRPVADIRSIDEAIAFGNCIGEVVRIVTADPNTLLHLSIAGGRKTMSYHAGAAMTLFGRAGDELSHVLIQPAELEACKTFWWPTKEPGWVDHDFAKDADGRPHRYSTQRQDVRVDLVDTPFFRGRSYLPPDLLKKQVDYGHVIRLANLGIGRPKLVIDLTTPFARIGGIDLSLSTSELALYALYARRARDGLPPLSLKVLNNPDDPARREFERYRERVASAQTSPARATQHGTLNSTMTRLNQTIRAALVQPELLSRFALIEPQDAERGCYAMPALSEEIELNLEAAGPMDEGNHA